MARIEICKTCRFFHLGPVVEIMNQPAQARECRAHSPSAQSQRWPTVHADDWCGEWQSSTPAADAMLQAVRERNDPDRGVSLLGP